MAVNSHEVGLPVTWVSEPHFAGKRVNRDLQRGVPKHKLDILLRLHDISTDAVDFFDVHCLLYPADALSSLLSTLLPFA
jgi:hypothetical protein